VVCTLAIAMTASAQEVSLLVRTDSPRDTLASFLRLREAGEEAILRYTNDQNHANFERVLYLSSRFMELLDLSSVPAATREEAASDTIDSLLDIFGRLNPPLLENVPGVDAFDDEETPAKWRIPRTPIWIVRMEDGPREGEFLFSGRTVHIAPEFYQRIRHLPLRTSLGIDSWTGAMSQLHGPMIPMGLVSALPDSLKRIWFGTPIWKILTAAILILLAALLLVALHRLIHRRAPETMIATRLRLLLTPVMVIIVIVLVLNPLITLQLNLSGSFARSFDSLMMAVTYLAVVRIFWLTVLTFFDWCILSPKIADESLDASLTRLSARVLGFIGSVFILSYGAHELGLPVLGLLTGLGVGGLAVALAIRPTLENLIGGLILFTDRPVRVGDFCTFGAHTGTVESIGVRSTKIRALDRTVISVPNAAFADMEIINWARCDKMLIQSTIGLRYETDPDQLRYVLAKMREMFHAHPKIDRDTVRVRFTGYGASSLDIQIRVYALTREWNDFHAIREDVFLRVSEIVSESGTGFAFPSQTLYLGRDDGLDKERSQSAIRQVGAWRRSGRLPFPRMENLKIEQLAGTLDYPPLGSPGTETPVAADAAESLSAEPELEDTKASEAPPKPESQ
jgi:MscS family membrane protein